MSKNSLDLSGKIDSDLVALFKTVSDVAETQGISFFVAGATARDIILHHGYGIKNFTFTADIDFGVNVASWSQYVQLMDGLLSTGKFPKREGAHRLVYQDGCILVLVDIVFFGGIASEDVSIAWPPENAVIMNVLGFEEAFHHALDVRLSSDPDVTIAFSSIAGLALMKLIAWNDGFTGNTDNVEKRLKKDSSDLLLLMREYLRAGNNERMMEEHEDILEVDDFDYETAGSRLLGRDIRELVNGESMAVVMEILERETDRNNRNLLVENMLDNPAHSSIGFEKCLGLLDSLKIGITDEVGH